MLTTFGALVLVLVSGCSCVFYGSDRDFAYALTAAHCVGGEGSAVNCRNGSKTFGCRVVSVDRKRDIAILKADKVHVGDVACRVVNARFGEELTLVGFPSGREHVTRGHLESSKLKGSESYLVSATSGVVGGMSGGGVFNSEGLVGVVTHGGSDFAGCSIVDRILDRQTDRVVAKSSEMASDALSPSLRDLLVLFLGWLSRYYFPGANMTKLVPSMTPAPK